MRALSRAEEMSGTQAFVLGHGTKKPVIATIF
jgi:hypothetical protein